MELNVNKDKSILAELILIFANVLQIGYNSFLIESEQRVMKCGESLKKNLQMK